MQVGQFPASAAHSLIEGYCDDFVSLAAVMAQTLEQVSMRGIDIRRSHDKLTRIETGMRGLADAIQDLLERGQVTPDLSSKLETGNLPARRTDQRVDGEDTGGFVPPSDWILPPSMLEDDDDNDEATKSTAAENATTELTPDMLSSLAAGPKPTEHAPQPPAQPPGPCEPPTFERSSEAFGLGRNHTRPPAPQPTRQQAPSTRPAPQRRNDGHRNSAVRSPHSRRERQTREAKQPTQQVPPAQPPQSAPPTQPAQPTPSAQPAPSAQPVDDGALRGTSQSMPVLSVFQFLGRTRKSGVMTIRLPDETMCFEFENGCVQACKSTQAISGERLGDLLLETTGCNPQDLARLLDGQNAQKAQLGELVVQSGLATNGQVLEALELQVRRRFARACAAPEAQYEFCDGFPNRTDGRVRIAPAELTYDSNWEPGD